MTDNPHHHERSYTWPSRAGRILGGAACLLAVSTTFADEFVSHSEFDLQLLSPSRGVALEIPGYRDNLANILLGQFAGSGFDFDRDGRSDLLIGNAFQQVLYTELQSGQGRDAAPSHRLALRSVKDWNQLQMDANDRLFGPNGGADLDGDGFGDLLVTAKYAHGDPRAAVTVIHGGTAALRGDMAFDALVRDHRASIQTFRCRDEEEIEHLSVTGDVNGDGLTDFAVICSDASPRRFGTRKTVYVIPGRQQRYAEQIYLHEMPVSSRLRLTTDHYRTSPGRIYHGGDLNGDGRRDLIVRNATDASIAVLYGRADLAGDFSLECWSAATFAGSEHCGFGVNGGFVVRAGNRLDIKVASRGDINGDGMDDLVFPYPHTVKGIGDGDGGATAQVAVLFGSRDRNQGVVSMGSHNGFSLYVPPVPALDMGDIELADMNGDGISDILTIAHDRLHVLFGHRGAWPAVMNVATADGLSGFTIVHGGLADELSDASLLQRSVPGNRTASGIVLNVWQSTSPLSRLFVLSDFGTDDGDCDDPYRPGARAGLHTPAGPAAGTPGVLDCPDPAPTVCADDVDCDSVRDELDNCRRVANAGQLDVNGNGIGDVCDAVLADLDGNGRVDSDDIKALVETGVDVDANGFFNFVDRELARALSGPYTR